MNQQPQPKRRKAMVKRQQQINCTSREISEAILQQDTKQLDAVAPREISNSRQASDDEADGLQFESNDAYGEASLVGHPSCFKKKPPRSLMLMKMSSQMSLALTQHTSPAMPAYKIQVMKRIWVKWRFWIRLFGWFPVQQRISRRMEIQWWISRRVHIQRRTSGCENLTPAVSRRVGYLPGYIWIFN